MVNYRPASGLKALKEMAGDKFHRSIVLYTGSNILGFTADIQAVPASVLWETTSGQNDVVQC